MSEGRHHSELRASSRAKSRTKTLSTRGPITLFIIVMVLTVTLGVLWNVVLVHDYQKLRELAVQSGAFHGTFVALGSALFLTIIVLSSILGAQLIGHIRWSQRQSNFIASVSHELNSPLSSIKLFAQTLRQPELAIEDRRNFAEKILFDVERLSRLITNILRAAEVDNRGEELLVLPREVELRAYLQDYLKDAEALHKEDDLRLTLAGDSEAWVDLDRMMFRQVLDNLIDNAVRYRGPTPPRVEIHVLGGEPWVRLSVTDHGVGVPASELPKLFDRFFRVEKAGGAPAARRGTGIGLYVVRSIVAAHGGKVSASSAGPGEGTTIRITLPALSREDIAA